MPETPGINSFNAESLVDTVREPMLVLNADLRVRTANRSFYRTFKVTPEETVDRLVYDLGNQQWDIPWLRKLLEEVLPRDTAFDDFEVEHVFPTIGRKFMLLNARRICGKDDQTEFILLAIEDTTAHRQVEEARREIESRYTSLVKNLKDHAIITMDTDGRINSWNVEAERILGYSESEILGQPFSLIFTIEDRQAGIPEEELRLAREHGRAEDERWHVRKGGERFWALGIVTPTQDSGGTHTGFSKILRDMTDRKRAEEALHRAQETLESQVRERTAELRNTNEELQKEIEDRKMAERRLNAQHAATKALAESPNLGAAVPQILEVVCESMGWAWAAVWMVNSQAKRLGLAQFWRSPSSNLDEFLTICREKTFAEGEGLLGRVWSAGEPAWEPDVMRYENLVRRHAAAQGGLHGALFSPILLGQDVVGVIEFFSHRIEQPDEKILGLATAIGIQIGQFMERKQAEVTLSKGQEFLKAVLENAQDLIVACDAQGVLAFINRAARELHGKGGQHVPADEWSEEFDLYHADGVSPMTKADIPLYRALNGEIVRDVEMVIRPQGGLNHTLLATGQAITDARGQKIGAVVVMHDVTERNLLEQQMRQSQKMEAFGQLAGGVAHDFNNLLTIISGYSELMLNSLHPDDSNRDSVREIHKAGERAALLTRQLLAFSRKQVVQLSVLDLNGVVASTEKMLGRLIGEDINLTTVLDPTLKPVKVDHGQIEQVVMNLAVNARDAMPQGGRLTIETHNVTLDEAYCQSHPGVQPGTYSMLAVTDTGTGMDEATKVRIFEPFFTTKETGKGTGLGMAVVHGVVKQSGGSIEVDTELGRGTAFKLYFPHVKEALATSPSKSSPRIRPMPTGNETLLLVEDEDAVRAFSRHVLQSCGYTLLEARDGLEAIRVAQNHVGPIHLVVSDVVMPHLGGRQLAERLGEVCPNLKVLFLSGYTDDAVVRHGILAADVAFLQKPFTPSALAQKVRAVLDES